MIVKKILYNNINITDYQIKSNNNNNKTNFQI